MNKKKKKLLYSVTGIVATMFIVVISFGFPKAIISIRDHRLEKKESHYTSTPISITTNNGDFLSRIDSAGELIWTGSYTEVNGNVDDKFAMDEETAWENSLACYYDLFRSKCTDDTSNIKSLDDFKQNVSETSSYILPIVLMNTSSGDLYYAWTSNVWLNTGEYIQVYIDDKTGKLLGFLSSEKSLTDIDIDSFAKGIAEYYECSYIDYKEKEGNGIIVNDIKMRAKDRDIGLSLCCYIDMNDPYMSESDECIFFNALSQDEIRTLIRGY